MSLLQIHRNYSANRNLGRRPSLPFLGPHYPDVLRVQGKPTLLNVILSAIGRKKVHVPPLAILSN